MLGPLGHGPMRHFGSFWALSLLFWALLGTLGHFGSSWPFRAMLAILGYSGPFWATLGPQGHFGPSGHSWPFWAYGPFWVILAILGHFDLLGHSRPSGPFWAHSAILGPLSQSGFFYKHLNLNTIFARSI